MVVLGNRGLFDVREIVEGAGRLVLEIDVDWEGVFGEEDEAH